MNNNKQIALTEAEVSSILLKAPDSLPEKYCRNLIGSKPRPTWHLKRKPSGKDAHCLSCFKAISEGELHIEATALWKPRDRDQPILKQKFPILDQQRLCPSKTITKSIFDAMEW